MATLSVQVRELTDLTASIDQRMADENVLTQQRITTQHTMARRALVAGFIGTIVGLVALVAVGISVKVDSAFHRQTHEARVGSCVQQQQSAVNAIAAADDHDLVLANLLSPPASRTLAMRAAVADDLARLHESSVRKNPLRNCSNEGIEQFLSGHGGYETTTIPHRG